MRRRILGLLLLVAGTLGAPRGARADSADATAAPVVLFGFGVVDAGLLLTDLGAVANQAQLPRGFGGFEIVAGGAQVGYCVDTLWSHPDGSFGTLLEIAMVPGAILMLHGIVTLVGPQPHAESPGAPRSVTVAPVALSDVTRVSVPGLAVLGRF
jgi:hypothetical protein